LLNNYKFAKSVGKTGKKADEAKEVIAKGINYLELFQNDDGGFGIWINDKYSLPYLSAYIGKLLVDAQKEGLLENKDLLKSTINYLKNLGQSLKLEGKLMSDSYEALALSAKVLAEYGESPDNILTRLSSNLGSLETITLCHLWDAAVLSKKNELSQKIESVIKSRISYNGAEARLLEKDNASNNYYYWWNKDITTAVGLKSFIANTKDLDTIEKLAFHLINQEKAIDRYVYNTHRNSYIYEALTAYAKTFPEDKKGSEVSCKINGAKIWNVSLKEENFWEAKKTIPMAELLKYSQRNFKIEFESSDNSKINYFVKLKWYPKNILKEKEERGFKIERKYYDLVTREEKKTFKAGDLIEVQLEINPIQDQANVAVVDILPAGFEVLDSAFATTAKNLNKISERNDQYGDEDDPDEYWRYYYGRFDHIEKHDDKVLLFSAYLYKEPIKFSYIVRATTEGEFRLQGAEVFCMYNEEVRGTSSGSVIKVEK
ncbi:MAG: hypothetical protein N2445_04365, partial [Acidobacteria bacterium]|nr:hypothetical protein [Acidobacteriota bacterium]